MKSGKYTVQPHYKATEKNLVPIFKWQTDDYLWWLKGEFKRLKADTTREVMLCYRGNKYNVFANDLSEAPEVY